MTFIYLLRVLKKYNTLLADIINTAAGMEEAKSVSRYIPHQEWFLWTQCLFVLDGRSRQRKFLRSENLSFTDFRLRPIAEAWCRNENRPEGRLAIQSKRD